MKKILFSILIVCFAFTVVYAKDFVTATDIQKINLGDTFEQVSQKVSEPQQVLSKELTDDGKEKVVWLYEAVSNPNRGGGIIRSVAEERLASEKIYQSQKIANPPYLVIFINGKVASIKRQQEGSIPTAQVNVANY